MGRPRNTVRKIQVKVWLPEPLVARIFAVLHSDLEGHPPFGAISGFFEAGRRGNA